MSYILRMQQELTDLNEKIEKILAFINTNAAYGTLKPTDRALLVAQRHAMEAYSIVLETRIRRALA